MASSAGMAGSCDESDASLGREGVSWMGRRLDVRAWRLGGPTAEPDGSSLPDLARTCLERARDAAGASGLRHLVIGVIGPRDASDTQERVAREIGRSLGFLSLTTICGGRGGVMEAVCKGVQEVGGLSIGILPGHDPESANPYVGIPLPTGLSEGRNMVIARAARALIAVGGSYGTLTEMAYGLHFGKPVIALDDAPDIAGLTRVATSDHAIEACCAALLRQAETAGRTLAEAT